MKRTGILCAKDQSGALGLADAALGGIVAAILLPAVTSAISDQSAALREQVAAQQLKAVSEAAQAFLKEDFANQYGLAGSAGDWITLEDLKGRGTLPSGFAAANAYGQKPVILVRQIQDPAAGCGLPATGSCRHLLEALVITTGGQSLDVKTAAAAAALSGAGGGIIGSGDVATGTYGGWSEPLAGFAGVLGNGSFQASFGTQPARSGRLASLLYLDGGTLVSDYLYRFATGNPDDNTMHAALTMGGNDIAAAGKVTADQVYSTVYYHSSDARLKTDIRPIADALGLVRRLQGVTFRWKADGAPDLGLVAQAVRPVLPEAVGESADGKLTVKYDVLVAPLIEAVKVLAGRVAALEAGAAPPGRANDGRDDGGS